MNSLEEFFKNRVSFTLGTSKDIISKQTFKPEDYSLGFLKEKTKSFCYFLKSISKVNNNDNPIINNRYSWIHIFIGEKYENSGRLFNHIVIVIV